MRAQDGNQELAKLLLSIPGADPVFSEANGFFSNRCLHLATAFGGPDIIGLLLKDGHANMLLKSFLGATALHLAYMNEKEDIIPSFILHIDMIALGPSDAISNSKLCARAVFGRTALDLRLAQSGHQTVADIQANSRLSALAKLESLLDPTIVFEAGDPRYVLLADIFNVLVK
jgi:ankyrin repeat protein